ncbi:TPA: MurR/RpiR family transcriptional regulator, partial [Vibrio cholerae]|nr:MurR/RpiR family transcriptional regulator [Vibrio cholerae]
MSVLQRIVSRRTQLSESGRQIGDWVLANAAQAAAMTSQDLAAWANVSQSSIVKFTQRLGFKGYSEFKLALTEELGRKQVMVNQPLH